MTLRLFIWTLEPDIFELFGREIRWYGLMWALAFYLGYYISGYIFRHEKKPELWAEQILMYILIAVVIGARLGHVFFYSPGYYLANPLEILYIHKGGLASHGALLGGLVGAFLLMRKWNCNYFWLLDRIVILACLGGACIRLGNFANSEIYGKTTDSPVGIVFAHNFKSDLAWEMRKLGYPPQDINIYSHSKHKDTHSSGVAKHLSPMLVRLRYARQLPHEDFRHYLSIKLPLIFRYKGADYGSHSGMRTHVLWDDNAHVSVYAQGVSTYVEFTAFGIKRHPTQLYEAFFYVLLFLVLYMLWRRSKAHLKWGTLSGIFFCALWTFRFLIEYTKEAQEDFANPLPWNMGQMLSVPCVLFGLWLVFFYKPNMPATPEQNKT